MNFHILPFDGEKIRLMFMDEAAFGRINDPAYCWSLMGERPIVPCQMVREYVYVYGAVDPYYGDKFFVIAPTCNTQWTNLFLSELSKRYCDDYILLCVDNAGWHKSKALIIPENIRLFYIPPRTPEMNPIEQIWKEVRKRGFKNVMFKTIDLVIDKLCDTLNSLSKQTVKSITGRDWILSMF